MHLLREARRAHPQGNNQFICISIDKNHLHYYPVSQHTGLQNSSKKMKDGDYPYGWAAYFLVHSKFNVNFSYDVLL